MKSHVVTAMILASYIMFMVGVGVADIGKVREACEPTSWYLPLFLFFMLAVPAFLGYMLHVEMEKNI